MSQNTFPKVGVGVIVVKDGKVLIGKRIGDHAPWYSIPGGHLELGETFENAAIREVKEETNLDIKNPRVIAVTNNLETYKSEGRHYVSIVLLVEDFSGELHNKESEKIVDWLWCDPRNLPVPHFDASRMGIEYFLKGVFYVKPEI